MIFFSKHKDLPKTQRSEVERHFPKIGSNFHIKILHVHQLLEIGIQKTNHAHQPEVVKHVFCLPKVDLVQRLPHLVLHVLGGRRRRGHRVR